MEYLTGISRGPTGIAIPCGRYRRPCQVVYDDGPGVYIPGMPNGQPVIPLAELRTPSFFRNTVAKLDRALRTDGGPIMANFERYTHWVHYAEDEWARFKAELIWWIRSLRPGSDVMEWAAPNDAPPSFSPGQADLLMSTNALCPEFYPDLEQVKLSDLNAIAMERVALARRDDPAAGFGHRKPVYLCIWSRTGRAARHMTPVEFAAVEAAATASGADYVVAWESQSDPAILERSMNVFASTAPPANEIEPTRSTPMLPAPKSPLAGQPVALCSGIVSFDKLPPRDATQIRQGMINARDKAIRLRKLGYRRFYFDRVFYCVPGADTAAGRAAAGKPPIPTEDLRPDHMFCAGLTRTGEPVRCSPLGPGQADRELDPIGGMRPTDVFREILVPLIEELVADGCDVFIYTSPPPWAWSESNNAMDEWFGPIDRKGISLFLDTWTLVDPEVTRATLGRCPADAVVERARDKNILVYAEPHVTKEEVYGTDPRLSGVATHFARLELMVFHGRKDFLMHPTGENFGIFDGGARVDPEDPKSRRLTPGERVARGRALMPFAVTPIMELGDADDPEAVALLAAVPSSGSPANDPAPPAPPVADPDAPATS